MQASDGVSLTPRSEADVNARVLGIVADVFDLPAESAELNAGRASIPAWDSVGHLRLILEVEDVFGVSLPDEDVADLGSPREVAALVARRLGLSAAADE